MKIIDRGFLPKNERALHASTIEYFNGHFVYSWFEGVREGSEFTRIAIYNLDGNNDLFYSGVSNCFAAWNPILFAHKDKLILFEKFGVFCDSWQTFYYIFDKEDCDKVSTNNLSSYRNYLPAGLNGPVKTKPLVDKEDDNIIYCGSSVETFFDWTSYIEKYRCSEKNLEFCSKSNPIGVKKQFINNGMLNRTITKGIIQPTIFRIDNNIYSFFRSSKGLNKIYYSSKLEGDNWGEAISLEIDNPNSGIDTVVIGDRLFLAYNPSKRSRVPLVLSELDTKPPFEIKDTIIIKSFDENEMKKNQCISREFSYPYMIAKDDEIHITYTFGRSKIEHCVIKV